MNNSRYQDIIKRLISKGVIINNAVRHDVKCGIHSGFKNCCIIYYLTSWKKSIFIRKLSKSSKLVGYVPCLRCEKTKRYVQYKDCNCRYILKLSKLYKVLEVPVGYKFRV